MMDETLVRKIKQTVAGNFDQSYEIYDEFEKKYGFFADLALALADFSGLPAKARVLDLGCGSGASSRVLAEDLGCEVVGLDLSPEMVAHGRRIIREPRVKLLVGDACDPPPALNAAGEDEPFDAALYNASIFILPEVEKSLAAAALRLKPGGIIAFSFYPEIVAADGRDLWETAFSRRGGPRPKKQTIIGYAEALQGLIGLTREYREGVYEKPFDEEFLTAFFSIPAQSASLFPRLDYEERKSAVRELFRGLAPEAETAKIIWRLAAGKI